jgi:hypothetical protein
MSGKTGSTGESSCVFRHDREGSDDIGRPTDHRTFGRPSPVAEVHVLPESSTPVEDAGNAPVDIDHDIAAIAAEMDHLSPCWRRA